MTTENANLRGGHQPRREEDVWTRFVSLRAWEHFDPDLDNVGGADSMTEQARSVIARMADELGLSAGICPASIVTVSGVAICEKPLGHEGHHMARGLNFRVLAPQ